MPSPLPGEALGLRTDKPVELNFFLRVLKEAAGERRRAATDCGLDGREGWPGANSGEATFSPLVSSMVVVVVAVDKKGRKVSTRSTAMEKVVVGALKIGELTRCGRGRRRAKRHRTPDTSRSDGDSMP